MIPVAQSRTVRPHLFETTGSAAAEREAAITFYEAPENRGKPFDFRVYRDKAVKEVLSSLFHGKCAYCESRFDATQPVDVEHWRPKGGVEYDEDTRAKRQGRGKGKGKKATGKRHPGYFWLAADWSNLLPSCIDCNRRREHKLYPKGERRVLGKGNYFPLRAGCRRAEKPGEELAEEPLLLNPYHDDPATVLTLGDEGEIRPLRHEGEAPDPRAEASIQYYALNRTGLVQARREVLHRMEQHMYVIRQLAYLLSEELQQEVRMLAEDLIAYEMMLLQDFANPERPYSFAAQQVIARFDAELRSEPNTGGETSIEEPGS